MSAYDEVTEMLRQNGYSQSTSANRFGASTWSRKGCPAVRIIDPCSAVEAERVRVQVQRDLAAVSLKRKPKSFRLRSAAAKREAALEKRRLEIEARIEARNRELGGMRQYLNSAEAHAIQLKIEADERELHTLQRLMTQVPSVNAHSGRPRAQHRSGSEA